MRNERRKIIAIKTSTGTTRKYTFRESEIPRKYSEKMMKFGVGKPRLGI